MNANNFRNNPSPDPFLLSQSIIVSGSGKALVCCVGINSRRGILDEKLDTTSKTPLQIKLDNLGARFTKYGIFASFAILVASLVRFVILILANDMDTGKILNLICNDIAIAVTVIIVAVPEGLPLTIGISLAYSVTRMKKDGILIKNLNSPEVMGCVDEICTGKTTTMTKGDMKLVEFYTENRMIKNSRKNTLISCELTENTVELIKESILFNAEARIEMDD
jgi:Ca2+-transporting ATPase